MQPYEVKAELFTLPPLYTRLIFALFGLTLLIGLFTPLQVDEISWSYQNHRAIYDGGQLMTLMPQCQEADQFLKPLPYSWYPHAWVNHILFMNDLDPLWIRIVGIIRCVSFLGLVCLITKAVAPTLNITSRSLFVLFLAVLALDTMPLQLAVNRPEQTILISCGIFLTLALYSAIIAKSRLMKYAAVLLYAGAVLLLFPSHAKAIAALPVALVCGGVLFYRLTTSRIITAIVLLAVLWFVASSVALWIDRYSCPHSTLSQMVINDRSLPLDKITTDPLYFLTTSAGIFLSALVMDLNPNIFLEHSMDWMPPSITNLPSWILQSDSAIKWALCFIRICIFIFCGILTLKFLLEICKKLITPSQDYWSEYILHNFPPAGGVRSREVIPTPMEVKKITNPLLGAVLFISLIGFMLVPGKVRLFYLATQHISLLMLCYLLFISGNKFFHKHVWENASGVIIALMLVNVALLTVKYYPLLTTDATRERWMPYHASLVNPWNYAARREKIIMAYDKCGLPPVATAKRLVLDDYTYPALKMTSQPFHYPYVRNPGFYLPESVSPHILLDFMKEYGSGGMLVDCRGIPPQLEPFVENHQGYCCLKTMIRSGSGQ